MASKQPLISVLMPAYNAEKYIGQAIESILKQTFKDFKFIILDDASTDNTWNIIQKYAKKDKRIITLKNKKNLKICKTLNKGIRIAKGKYIARMDADDWSYPYRLKKQYEFMEKNPDVVISGGTMEICNEKLKIVAKREYKTEDKDLKKVIFRYSPFCHPATIYKTKFVKKIGGYHLLYGEDIELYFKLGQFGKFGNLRNVLIKYRDIPSSMTNTKSRITELHTIKLRFYPPTRYKYKMNFFDKMYNILQLISLFIMPTRFRIWLFSSLRNKKI